MDEERERNPKYNVKDLSEKGNVEVRFFQKYKMNEEEQEDTIEEVEEEPINHKVFENTTPTIKIDPEMTTKVVYYEPETKKDKRSWFSRNFMCCN
jgi:hypothetical protein